MSIALSEVPTPPEDNCPRPAIRIAETRIPGCFLLSPTVANDARGSFTKLFHRPLWRAFGMATEFAEEYVTHSHRHVLRGLHFQLPPMEHAKVVACLEGEVLDVALDLRRGSPTFGEHLTVRLSGAAGEAIYLPAGVAHGFLVTGSHALLYYKVTSVYSPAHDSGIRWNSAGIPWPVSDPVISERDQHLPAVKDFTSPFCF